MTTAAAPQVYECSIQGALADDVVVNVLERLRGLCSSETPLHYREIVYRSLPFTGIFSLTHITCSFNLTIIS